MLEFSSCGPELHRRKRVECEIIIIARTSTVLYHPKYSYPKYSNVMKIYSHGRTYYIEMPLINYYYCGHAKTHKLIRQ